MTKKVKRMSTIKLLATTPYLVMCVMYIVLIAHLVLYEPKDRQRIIDTRLKFWCLDGKFNELYVWVGMCYVLAIIGVDFLQDPVLIKLRMMEISYGMQALLGYSWAAILIYNLIKKLRNLND